MAISSVPENEPVAITGSTGFIGSHLARTLEAKKIPFIVFKGNLLDLELVKAFFSIHPVKKVIHLAGSFAGSFEQLVQKNVIATQHLLEAGTNAGLQKIIYTSTGAVYGEPSGEVSLESDDCQPNTLYGLSKKMAEDVIFHYHLVKGISYVILRFPNVYGEGNRKGVVYNFLKDIHSKGSITVAGDGNQCRNFLHVSDACTAIIKSIHYGQSDVFNISTNTKTSINDLVALLKHRYSFRIIHKAADNHLKNLLLDASKAERILDFKPAVQNPQTYIEYFKDKDV
jgi:UDP-glucose 4-epimerase